MDPPNQKDLQTSIWRHKTRPIQFTLFVDNFGIKNVGREHADHLLGRLEHHYPAVATDWKGELYCGITLKWNYAKGYINILILGYIKRLLLEYKHKTPSKPQYSPYLVQPRKLGKAVQEPMPKDKMPKADEVKKKQVQQVVGSILYFGKGVNLTTLTGLSTLTSEQSRATGQTIMNMEQLLDYLTNPNVLIQYYASDVILNIHSNASYLSEQKARSRAAGHFFLSWLPKANEPIRLNGVIHSLCNKLNFVAALVAKAELGALFLNVRHGRIVRLALQEIKYPQQPTPINCNNSTTRSMEMQYFYVNDQVDNKQFKVEWHPCQENLGNYNSKHHKTKHHRDV